MAVELQKPVKRECRRLKATKHGRIAKRDEIAGMRPVIVELNPSEEIVFRVKKTKRRYSLSFSSAFQLAQLRTTIQSYNQKVERYTQDKKFGMRRKKPKRPVLPYTKNFFQLL